MMGMVRAGMIRVWLILLAIVAAGAAQTTPAKKKAAIAKAAAKKEAPAATQWPVESLAVQGNRRYTSAQILAISRIQVGQLAGKPEFEAARERLIATGAFETVGYKFESGTGKQGYVASFQVTEVEPAYPIYFEELGVPDGEIQALLLAKDPLFATGKVPATKPLMERYTAWIQEYLAAKGLAEPIVGKVIPGKSEEYAILFRPARNLPAVAQVTFSGNKAIPQGALREAVHGSAVGSPYTEAGFRELLNQALRPVYEQRGRVRVAFTEIRAEPVSDVVGVHVFVKVDEGESYTLGKVEIAEPSPVEARTLIKAADIKTGDVANFDRVNEGLDRIRKAVRHAGYLDGKVTTERKIDDEKKLVDVLVKIDSGALYTMGKLTIIGLDLNGEAEILRIWALKESKTFNPEYPDLFLTRIKEEGLFDGLGETKAVTKIDAQKHTVDVTLNFGAADPTKKPERRGGRGGRGMG
jgi:outer membrane protein insertion porin family